MASSVRQAEGRIHDTDSNGPVLKLDVKGKRRVVALSGWPGLR